MNDEVHIPKNLIDEYISALKEFRDTHINNKQNHTDEERENAHTRFESAVKGIFDYIEKVHGKN